MNPTEETDPREEFPELYAYEGFSSWLGLAALQVDRDNVELAA